MDKLIITAAVTGGVTVPTQTPYLPLTPQEIADEAVRAAEAGAASIHIHARDPQDGRPTADPEVFGEILSRIKARSDVIVCTTTGGGFGMTAEERIRVVPTFEPEMASFNTGSINFSLYPVTRHYQAEDYKYPWEQSYLEGTHDHVFRNTFADMQLFLETMKACDTRPEFEAYDVGHLHNLAYLVKTGYAEPPLWIQFVMGVLGGIRNTIEDAMVMKQTADRLFGPENYRWSVIGVGYPMEFKLGTLAIMMGGHVRVGLEDNIRIRRGVLARSNAELVEKMVRIAGEFEREIASPDEVRQMLGLKGRDRVKC